MQLFAHDRFRPSARLDLGARVERRGALAVFAFDLIAPEGAVRWPPAAASQRTDGLWRTTCFEAFVGGQGESYAEFNFSPSTRWAAYRFDSHRRAMRPLDLSEDPQIHLARTGSRLHLRAEVLLPEGFGDRGAPLGLSAVIEEKDGSKSYWALAHPSGDPDFHRRDCFLAKLP